jgi:putative GTP pyrophosphokinase
MTAEPSEDQIETWSRDFDAHRHMYQALLDEVQFSLDAAIAAKSLKVHSCISRLKSAGSFREKITRKKYADPTREMTDIVGARIVCLFLDDLEIVNTIIDETFDVIEYEDKSKMAPPDFLRYQSVHYNCRIHPSHSGPRYDPIKEIIFEVQCRTILQDAWATVEHYLAYKGSNSIPDELRRDFSALVGLFHVADKSFQQLFNASLQKDIDAQAKIHEVTTTASVTGTTSEQVDVVIDRSTIKAFLRSTYEDRKRSSDSTYSEFVEELAAVEITGITHLRSLLLQGHNAAADFETDHPPYDEADKSRTVRYTDVGFGRLAVRKALPEFDRLLERKRKATPRKVKRPTRKSI